jgi:hypothetical protein
MEVDYFAIGRDLVTGQTTSAYDPGDDKPSTTALPMSSDDAALFTHDLLVRVLGVPGYLEDGTTVDPNPMHSLLLQVVGKTTDGNNKPVFYAINGPKTSSANTSTYVPAIPGGSTLVRLTTAASENQLFTGVSSYAPVSRRVYMQRQLLNIQIGEFFDRATKRVKWGKEEIVEKAIREFRRQTEINYLMGQQSKRMITNAERKFAGQEYVYTSEGILPQIPETFDYVSKGFEYNDLLRLSEQLFSDNNGSKQALMCVGKDLATDILSVNYALYKDLNIGKSTHWGINMTDYTSLFGTISMVHYPMLDQIGLSKNGFAIDPSRLSRFVHRNQYHVNIDMKVHGEAATRDVYIQTDCLVLKGPNHAFIKPAAAKTNHAFIKPGA